MMRIHNLQLKMAGRILVDGLNWQIESGQCWCVIGRNGAGKSTLLRTLAGLRQPDGGSIEMQGMALADWPLARLARERSFLPQSRSDAFGYSVIEAILTARHPYHADCYWESSDDHQAAYAALEAMEVADLAERDVRTLSGGERQRVAIAALLAQDTPLLLLDEPANALDLAHQVSVMRLLARLCSERGKTAVMVGHDLNLAHSVASHALLLMGDGQWQAGTVADMMQAPILSRFLGHPIEAIEHGKRTIFIPAQEAA
jgi:iron complex transport system ATP-binding protein